MVSQEFPSFITHICRGAAHLKFVAKFINLGTRRFNTRVILAQLFLFFFLKLIGIYILVVTFALLEFLFRLSFSNTISLSFQYYRVENSI